MYDVRQIIAIMLRWAIPDVRKSEENHGEKVVKTTGNPAEILNFCLPNINLENHRYTVLFGPRSNCVPPKYRSATVRLCQFVGS
jgi:hypothetical protein